jgi:hypothetical protein
MKKLIITLAMAILLIPAFAWALDLSFMWDANTDNPDGYRIFMRIGSASYDYTDPVIECTGLGATVQNLDPTKEHYFVLRAFNTLGFESLDSNELNGGPPDVPQSLRFVQ